VDLLTKIREQQAVFQTILLEQLSSINSKATKLVRIGNRDIYIENDIKLNWTAAASRCRMMGGYLAAIENKEELAVITANLKTGTNYWLGINDREKENHFVHAATGMDAPLLEWKYGEPNNLNGIENCVVLNDQKMNDISCGFTTFFICQANQIQ
ncbi:hypothetical protein KR084_001968, partial [Drosophila pseudotakahashii]